MSYILDALKRSEQEERIRQTPALDADHVISSTRSRNSSESTNSILTILLLVSLIVATGTAVYLYLVNERQVETPGSGSIKVENTNLEKRKAADAVPTATESLGPGPTIVNPAVPDPIIIERAALKPTVAATFATTASIPVPVSIRDLPDHIQQKIPEMRFSSHIYAEDPTLRMVNINGNSIREGDAVVNGIILIKITEEGAVLRYRDHTFVMSVLKDWTSN